MNMYEVFLHGFARACFLDNNKNRLIAHEIFIKVTIQCNESAYIFATPPLYTSTYGCVV